MLDLLTTFVLVFFISYVVLSYVRPELVLCVKNNEMVISQGKLMLSSILFGLVAMLCHVIQTDGSSSRQLRFGRPSVRMFY